MCVTTLALLGLEEATTLLALVHDYSSPERLLSPAILYPLVDSFLPAPCCRYPPALERCSCHGNAESSESPLLLCLEAGREGLTSARCPLSRGQVFAYSWSVGGWVAYLPLEDLYSGKPPTPSQALRNGKLPTQVLGQHSMLVVLKLSSTHVY